MECAERSAAQQRRSPFLCLFLFHLTGEPFLPRSSAEARRGDSSLPHPRPHDSRATGKHQQQRARSDDAPSRRGADGTAALSWRRSGHGRGGNPLASLLADVWLVLFSCCCLLFGVAASPRKVGLVDAGSASPSPPALALRSSSSDDGLNGAMAVKAAAAALADTPQPAHAHDDKAPDDDDKDTEGEAAAAHRRRLLLLEQCHVAPATPSAVAATVAQAAVAAALGLPSSAPSPAVLTFQSVAPAAAAAAATASSFPTKSSPSLQAAAAAASSGFSAPALSSSSSSSSSSSASRVARALSPSAAAMSATSFFLRSPHDFTPPAMSSALAQVPTTKPLPLSAAAAASSPCVGPGAPAVREEALIDLYFSALPANYPLHSSPAHMCRCSAMPHPHTHTLPTTFAMPLNLSRSVSPRQQAAAAAAEAAVPTASSFSATASSSCSSSSAANNEPMGSPATVAEPEVVRRDSIVAEDVHAGTNVLGPHLTIAGALSNHTVHVAAEETTAAAPAPAPATVALNKPVQLQESALVTPTASLSTLASLNTHNANLNSNLAPLHHSIQNITNINHRHNQQQQSSAAQTQPPQLQQQQQQQKSNSIALVDVSPASAVSARTSIEGRPFVVAVPASALAAAVNVSGPAVHLLDMSLSRVPSPALPTSTSTVPQEDQSAQSQCPSQSGSAKKKASKDNLPSDLSCQSVIECGELQQATGRRQMTAHCGFFGKEVEIYTASVDPMHRPLYRASALAEKFGYATNKVGMYLARRRSAHSGIFQATAFRSKPPGRTGLKAGGYFLTMVKTLHQTIAWHDAGWTVRS